MRQSFINAFAHAQLESDYLLPQVVFIWFRLLPLFVQWYWNKLVEANSSKHAFGNAFMRTSPVRWLQAFLPHTQSGLQERISYRALLGNVSAFYIHRCGGKSESLFQKKQFLAAIYSWPKLFVRLEGGDQALCEDDLPKMTIFWQNVDIAMMCSHLLYL